MSEQLADAMTGELDRAVGDYLGRLTGEQVVGSVAGIRVTTRVDGELTDIDIDDDMMTRCSASRLGELLMFAIRDAGAKAGRRRTEIAEAVKVLDQPVLELARQLQEDPVGTAERLSAPRW